MLLDGHYGAREFSKLTVKNSGLFQSELALVDSIVPIIATHICVQTIEHVIGSLNYVFKVILSIVCKVWAVI